MNPLLEKNFISTKEASKLSGYNADYLSRLCREKRITASQIGRTWLIERESLEQFMESQLDRKIELAESLARERGRAYQRANTPLSRLSSKVRKAVKSRARYAATSTLDVVSLRNVSEQRIPVLTSRPGALALTALVLAASVSLAGTGVTASVGEMSLDAAFEARSSMISTITDVHELALEKRSALSAIAAEQMQTRNEIVELALDTRIETFPQVVGDRMAIAHEPVQVTSIFDRAVFAQETLKVDTNLSTVSSRVLDVHEDIGMYALRNIDAVNEMHINIVSSASDALLAFSVTVRDFGTRAPLALGTVIVETSHGILALYESGIYTFVDNAERVPSVLVTVLMYTGSSIGTSVESGIARAPRAYEESIAFYAANAASSAHGLSSGSFAFGQGAHRTLTALLRAEDRAVVDAVFSTKIALESVRRGASEASALLQPIRSMALNSTLGIAGNIAYSIEGVRHAMLTATPLATVDLDTIAPPFLKSGTSMTEVAQDTAFTISIPVSGFFAVPEGNRTRFASWITGTINTLTVSGNPDTILSTTAVIGSEETLLSNADATTTLDSGMLPSPVEGGTYIAGPYVLTTASTATPVFSGNIAMGSDTQVGTTAEDFLAIRATTSAWKHAAVRERLARDFSSVSTSLDGSVSNILSHGRRVMTQNVETLNPNLAALNSMHDWKEVTRGFAFAVPTFSSEGLAPQKVSGSLQDTPFTINGSTFTSLLGMGLSGSPSLLAGVSAAEEGLSFLERMMHFMGDAIYAFVFGIDDSVVAAVPGALEQMGSSPSVVSVSTKSIRYLIDRTIVRIPTFTTYNVTQITRSSGVSREYVRQELVEARNTASRTIYRTVQNDENDEVTTSGGATDVSAASLEDLTDVAAMTKVSGDLLMWDGTAWTNAATSTLGIVTENPVVWGDVTGTLTNQTDLQTALSGTLSLAAWYATTTDALTEGNTNQYYTTGRFATFLAGTSTDALTEGSTNRYYTDARARAAFSSALPGQSGLYYASSTGVLSLGAGRFIPLTASTTEWDTAFGWGNHALAGYMTSGNTGWDNIYNLFDKDTDTLDGILEGTSNRYFTDARVQTFLDSIGKEYFFSSTSTNAWLATKTTDTLSEGLTNFYFTNARARSALSAGSGLSYATSTGVLSLDATGNWTGTFDGQEGSYYLARANHTGTQLSSTISDFSTGVRTLLSDSATALDYDSGTGVLGLASGYSIPLTASTTNWNAFYDAPSSRISLGTGMTWSGNTIVVATSSDPAITFVQGGNSFATTTILGTLDNNALQFSTNALARLSILANGNVGLGTTTPTAKFAIDSTTLTGSNVFSIGSNTSNAISGTGGATWTASAGVAGGEVNGWDSLAYGNGLYVAVDNNGGINTMIMTSPDGITWTSRTSPNSNTWQAVTYGNGLFVAVASSGTGNRVMTSPDGITWTARTSAADNVWYGVTYGNGLFVAVAQTGTGNRVMTSPDGITWTSRTSAADNSWSFVTYGNNLFVAVSYSGVGNRVMTSPDGITWTSRTSAGDSNWYSVTYGNGMYVAVANVGTNLVMTSPDGITWTARTAAEANAWRGVTYGNGLFVAVAESGTNRVMTSVDGITWTARSAAEASTWRLVTYGNGKFVALAGLTVNRAMTSSIANTNYALLNLDSLGNLGLGTSTATARLNVGMDNLGTTPAFLVGTSALPKLVVSYDGNVGIGKLAPTTPLDVVGQSGTVSGASTWTARTVPQANQWRSVTYGNGLFVAVSSDGTNRVMTSPDGITWTARSAAEANSWHSVTYGNGLFVAVAFDGINRVMTSPDGITWTARTASVDNDWFDVTYGNGLFVAISYNPGTSQVMTSPDGINWTSRTAAEANSWGSVTYGNGLFVAVAYTGTNRVMTSPDGITWTARSAAEANSWYSVTYGNGLFVAVAGGGTTNRVMTSPDGITWTARSVPEANNWGSVTYGNGLFVAVSSDGTNRVMTSPDGITWTARVSVAHTWQSVIYGNGLFVAVAFSTNQVMTSPITAPAVARFANTTGENCTINPALTSLSCSSDERLKKNIVAVASSTDSLAKLSSLNAVFYNWNSEQDTDRLHAGFLAQSVQAILPDLVTEDGNGYLALNYAGFAPYLVSGIQQLNERTSFITSSTTASSTITLTTTGQGIGIGTNTITHMLTVAGDAAFAGSAYAESFVVPTDDTDLPSEVLTGGGVDLYRMSSYVIQRIEQEDARIDLIAERLSRIDIDLNFLDEEGDESVSTTTVMEAFKEEVLAEPVRTVLTFIEEVLSESIRPFADFIAVRITTLVAYFDSVHTEELCVARADGSETCLSKTQLAGLLLLVREGESEVTPSGAPMIMTPEEVIETPPVPEEPVPALPPESAPEPEIVVPVAEEPPSEPVAVEAPTSEPVAEDPAPEPAPVEAPEPEAAPAPAL